MSETSSVTKPIVQALNKAGYFALRLNSGKVKKGKYWIQLCPEGTADILVCPYGRLPIWVETKTSDGHTNKEQQIAQDAFRERVERLGHCYLKATSLDAVLKRLEAL